MNELGEIKIMQPDVYCLDINSLPIYIFEICNKHKTLESNRPRWMSWVEFDSKEVLTETNVEKSRYSFHCLRNRNFICSECHMREIKIKKQIKKMKEREMKERKKREIERKEREREREIERKEREIGRKELMYKTIKEQVLRDIKNLKEIKKKKKENRLKKEAISLAFYRHKQKSQDKQQPTLFNFFKVQK